MCESCGKYQPDEAAIDRATVSGAVRREIERCEPFGIAPGQREIYEEHYATEDGRPFRQYAVTVSLNDAGYRSEVGSRYRPGDARILAVGRNAFMLAADLASVYAGVSLNDIPKALAPLVARARQCVAQFRLQRVNPPPRCTCGLNPRDEGR